MIGMVTKAMFFDRKAVTDAVDRAARKVLSKFGAFVRTAAKHSIRKRKAVSQPGQPPSSHAGHLRRLIFFGYDPARKSVVIGPTPFRSEAEAPPLLEYGGRAVRQLTGRARRSWPRTGRGRSWGRPLKQRNPSCPPCGQAVSR